MLTRNLISGLIVIAIGIAYLAMTMQIRVSALADGFGPRGMPLVYGWLLTGLGVILVGQSLAHSIRLDSHQRRALQSKEWRGMAAQTARAAGLLGIAVLYVLIVPYLGYPLSLLLVIGGVALYMGARPTPRLLLISVAGAALMWVIFVGLLDVRMPQGIWATLFR